MNSSDEDYGRSIRAYRGKGHLRLANGSELPCQIAVRQVGTGVIVVTCKLSRKAAQDSAVLEFLMGFPVHEVDRVYGETEEGMSFTTQREVSLVASKIGAFSGKPSVLQLLAQEMEFWPESRGCAKYCEFSVVNFEFVGNRVAGQVIQDLPRQATQSEVGLLLNTHWGTCMVKRVADYDSIIRRVKAQRGIAVTCRVVAEPSDEVPLQELTSRMDQICRLLSLSRGTKITWVNAEEHTRDGRTSRIILRNAVTRPFSSLSLIDPREPSETPLFVEKAYPAYLRLRDAHNLDIAIENCLDAKRETAYLETRALAAVALIDSLQQQHASRDGFTEIVKGFGKHENRIRKYLESFVSSAFPSVTRDQLDEMAGKIPELNRRSFLTLLRTWVDGMRLEIPASELSAIRDTRHSLAHRMCFKSCDESGKMQEYFRLVNFINMVFLRLLGYQGYYIHVDLPTLVFERRQLE